MSLRQHNYYRINMPLSNPGKHKLMEVFYLLFKQTNYIDLFINYIQIIIYVFLFKMP